MAQTKFKPVAEQLAYLKKGIAEMIPEAELTAKLEKSLETGKPMRVYLGVDPTAPDIHLGHTVVLRKLKHFQDLGHTAIFLIGDFSAMIGDPTGQSETRPPLTREAVDANAKTYLAQVFKLLDPKRTEVRYNSEWLDKLSSYDIVRLCGHYRLARMLEREDFRSRLDKNQPISVHELLYPLLTAYDAVALQSDVEIGATEQKFNLLVHRDIQGMWPYYDLLTDRKPEEIAAIKKEVSSSKMHPMDIKMRLAQEVISGFHGVDAALKASENFQRVFRDRQAPEEMKEIVLKRLAMGISVRSKSESTFSSHMATGLSSGSEKWSKLLAYLGEAGSTSEAERVIKQGGFEVDGLLVKDPACKLDLNQPRSYEVRVGKKKFLRIVVE